MNRFATTVLVLFASAIWALILAHNGWIIPPSFFAPMSWVVSALVGLSFAHEKWIWRWPGVRSIVGRPDLRGTWKGVIRPNPETANTNANSVPIEVFMVIRQTFSTLHLRLLAPESQSFSLSTNLVEEAPEQFSLTWVYRSEPRLLVQERSRVHLGGGQLRVSGPATTSMSGHYWTDRGTSGELSLVFISRKRAADSEPPQS